MENIAINNKDLLVMKLVHYFITEENYNPVILHGINDEIWLENLDNPYKIIRIVNHYIHNNEQLNFDKFKFKKIISKLKIKTFSWKLKMLNIYTDLGDNVELESGNDYTSFFIQGQKDLKNDSLIKIFPDMLYKISHKEEGIDLFVKITDDINKKNMSKAKITEDIFKPKKPIITYAIIAICTLLFVSMYLFGSGSEDTGTLINFGANWDILTKSGEYYRLFTCMFLHIGIIHIMFNMYALYVIGPQVESFFGKFKFILIYIISGICGSILSLAFSYNTLSAGASGAIFGLLGALLYFGYHFRVFLGNVMKSQIIPIIILNLAIGFVLSGVDNAAHIGGLIGGVLTAMAVGIKEKTTKFERINGCIILTLYIAFIIYFSFIR